MEKKGEHPENERRKKKVRNPKLPRPAAHLPPISRRNKLKPSRW